MPGIPSQSSAGLTRIQDPRKLRPGRGMHRQTTIVDPEGRWHPQRRICGGHSSRTEEQPRCQRPPDLQVSFQGAIGAWPIDRSCSPNHVCDMWKNSGVSDFRSCPSWQLAVLGDLYCLGSNFTVLLYSAHITCPRR